MDQLTVFKYSYGIFTTSVGFGKFDFRLDVDRPVKGVSWIHFWALAIQPNMM
jgi:hypothetical protein